MKKRLLATLFLLMMMNLDANAQDNIIDVSSYSQTGSQYYTSGLEYMKTNQHTNAIAEFRKALRENPQDKSSRIQLVNAYLLRAQYYNNKAADYNKAANDLRSAIFYMKYYECAPVDAQYIQDVQHMEENLDNILYAMKSDQSAKGHFVVGKSLRAQGEFAAAAVEFHKSQTDPTYRCQSLVSLGEIYYILNLNDQAASYLEQAINIDSKDPQTHLKLARVYERMGLLDKAAQEYTLALSKSGENQDILLSLENIWRQKVASAPNDAEAHSNLGAILQKKGDMTGALEEYEKAEQINPSSITTRLNIGTMYQAKKEYETAIEAYDTIIQFNPNYMLAYLYKAQCYKEIGNKEAAIQNYKLALNLDPSNEQVKNELGETIEVNMTPQEKLDYLNQEIQKAPTNADLLYKYAYELHKANRLPDAILYYNRALTIDPKNEDTYLNLAQAYKQQGNYDKARTILTDAKGLFPDNALVKKQLQAIDSETASLLYADASDLFKQERYQEAIELYNKIMPATAESLVGIGASYQAMNNNKQAAEFYKKSLAIDPNNSDTAYYLALAYSNDNNFAQAKTYAKKAIALDANNKNARELLNYVMEQENTGLLDKAMEFYDKKDYVQALTVLNSVITQDPSEANAYYYRAMIYDAQKKYALAIADYQKALRYNPQMTIANYSIAVDYDYLMQYANALAYHKKYLAAAQKAGESNDYTNYSSKRIQDLKKYEPTAQPKK